MGLALLHVISWVPCHVFDTLSYKLEYGAGYNYELHSFQPSLPASDLAALLLQSGDVTLLETANQTSSDTEYTTV